MFVLTGIEYLRRNRGQNINVANANLEEKDRVSYEFDPDIVSKKMRWYRVQITGDDPGPKECHSCV